MTAPQVTPASAGGRKVYKKWTEYEKAIIRSKYPDGGTGACMPFMQAGRNRADVVRKAVQMNVRKKRKVKVVKVVTKKVIFPFGLSKRQHQAVLSLATGRGHKGVALDLGIEVCTVRALVRDAYKKMGVTSQVGAVLKAERNGMLKDIKI